MKPCGCTAAAPRCEPCRVAKRIAWRAWNDSGPYMPVEPIRELLRPLVEHYGLEEVARTVSERAGVSDALVKRLVAGSRHRLRRDTADRLGARARASPDPGVARGLVRRADPAGGG